MVQGTRERDESEGLRDWRARKRWSSVRSNGDRLREETLSEGVWVRRREEGR